MNYIRYDHIKEDTKNLADGEVFVTYREDQTWAFGMRINKTFTLSRFQSNKTDEAGVRSAKKQILFCKNFGWSFTGQKAINDETFDYDPVFICIYCKNTTFDSSDPCPCRGKTKEDFLKKSKSGIILPF